jgi:hypothetical protein
VFDDVIKRMKDEGQCKWLDVTCIVARDMFGLVKSDYGCKGDFKEEPEESDEEWK